MRLVKLQGSIQGGNQFNQRAQHESRTSQLCPGYTLGRWSPRAGRVPGAVCRPWPAGCVVALLSQTRKAFRTQVCETGIITEETLKSILNGFESIE